MNGVVVNHQGASCRHCFNNDFRPPKQKCLRGFFSLCRFGTVGEVRWSPKPVRKMRRFESFNRCQQGTSTNVVRPDPYIQDQAGIGGALKKGLHFVGVAELVTQRIATPRIQVRVLSSTPKILVDRTGKTSYNVYKLVRRV